MSDASCMLLLLATNDAVSSSSSTDACIGGGLCGLLHAVVLLPLHTAIGCEELCDRNADIEEMRGEIKSAPTIAALLRLQLNTMISYTSLIIIMAYITVYCVVAAAAEDSAANVVRNTSFDLHLLATGWKKLDLGKNWTFGLFT